MEDAQEPTVVETKEDNNICREGVLPDGSVINITIVNQPEEL